MSHPLPPKPEREELANATWFKASLSNGSSGCVQVAHLQEWTALRDSKDPGGPVHLFSPHEWDCFLDGVRGGEFDRA
jgi:hypothetical protein